MKPKNLVYALICLISITVVSAQDTSSPNKSRDHYKDKINFGVKYQFNIDEALKSKETHKNISLVNQNIEIIDKRIFEFTNVEVLDLSNNAIKIIPEEIKNLKNLKVLRLKNNKLTEIPRPVLELSNLELIDLSNNQIKSASLDFKSPNIRKVVLANNGLEKIILNINSSTIDELDLSGSNFPTFNENLSNLKDLKILFLNNSKIASFGSNANLPKSLGKLNLSGNALTTVPEILFSLPNLQILDLSNNKLEKINLSRMSNLSNLYLNRNKINSISFDNPMNYLIDLSITHQEADMINFNFLNMQSLKFLNISHNKIGKLDNADKLVNLEALDMVQVGLTEFPPFITNPQKIRKLNLSQNQITRFPSNFDKYQQLEQLQLSRNQITSIPNSIGQLANLKYLTLDNNLIENIPNELANCKNLKMISLRGNKISDENRERITKQFTNIKITF